MACGADYNRAHRCSLLARNLVLTRCVVAIKILPPNLSSSPDMKQRFEREARAISALNHPHICTLHDLGNQDDTDYLVMEFLEGESLAERSKKGPLPLKETLKIAIELCQALEAAHKASIIHRGHACYWWGATVFIFGCGKRIW